MTISRRDALFGALFGGGMVGLRSLASGLPVKLLLDPKKALADMQQAQCVGDLSKAQFIILATSGSGDPFSCNAPGTYDDPSGYDLSGVMHPTLADGSFDKTTLAMPNGNYGAAKPWAGLGSTGANVLGRTAVCHVMTNTPVHPKEPQVLQLMGATKYSEMFPSVLAAQLAPCLGTLQTQPISVGAASPSEALTFGGQALPTVPPAALAATLTNASTGANGNLTKLQSIRDDALNDMYQWYSDASTTSPAQRQYVDSLVASQKQVRGISQTYMNMLAALKTNTPDTQITAAIALILMGVSPVIAVHIPFGGDNHSDVGFLAETGQTVSGFQTIQNLFTQLRDPTINLIDRVSLITLNVFGRTMNMSNTVGRQHNPNHQVSMMIGKPFQGGVYGSVQQVAGDYGCTGIDANGKGTTATGGNNIAAVDTLASWGKTVLAGVGVSSDNVNSLIESGSVIQSALAKS